MANNFPALPALLLSSVTYTAQIVNPGQNWPTGGFDVAGVTVENVQIGASQEQTGIFTATFQFATPGTPGSFDQDAAETQLVSVLNDLAQAVATTGGLPLSAVQALTLVTRLWTWTDSGGSYHATWQDSMTYPPAS